MWFLSDPARLQLERTAVETLAGEHEWLQDVKWTFDEDARLAICFSIAVPGGPIPLRLSYPALFPAIAPTVSPADPNVSLSGHQYIGGALCLEHRPDNWSPTVTGADMIISAWRLLSTERRDPSSGTTRVPSEHRLSLGQTLRSSDNRFLLTEEWNRFCSLLDVSDPVRLEARFRFHGSAATALIIKAIDPSGEACFSPSVPTDGAKYKGLVLRLAEGNEHFLGDEEFARGMRDVARALIKIEPAAAYEQSEFIVLVCGDQQRLHWQLQRDQPKLTAFTNLQIGGEDNGRLPSSYSSLRGCKVALVGCGSVGSKVAASFARCGIADFLLVDDDVLLRDNLVRNDLDWRDVGEHKANALKTRIQAINPSAKVALRRTRLSGQESTSTTEATLSLIAKCDLIIDGTADPSVFTLLASAARAASKPLVWAEVFAGGIGGAIAQSRPGQDPSPEAVRAGILSWCAAQQVPWLGKQGGGYEAIDDGGEVAMADDPEVAIIAAHATRIAVDILLRKGAPIFAQPAYVIGLRPEWLFSAPFEVYPISVLAPDVPQQEVDQTASSKGLEFLGEVLQRYNEDHSVKGD